MQHKPSRISIVIPCYNESLNIDLFYQKLKQIAVKDTHHIYEFLYVDDGSLDSTGDKLRHLAAEDTCVRVLALSRNFGKEIATTAGIDHARGDALIMLDADGQFPVKHIPEFIQKWENGAQIVVGVRQTNQKEGFIKRYGSKLFYRMLSNLSGTEIIPRATDFRLIDTVVRDEFVRLTERNRTTRGLIDWIGFRQEYVYFNADARMNGTAAYNYSKLLKLALNSFVSLSLKPLYFTFYAGLVILPLSILLAAFSAGEMLVGDPMHLRITGTAYLVMLVLFLIGVVLISQGITALYLSHIHTETQNRPLYIADMRRSRL